MLMLSVPRLVLEPVASEHRECYPLDHDIQKENQFECVQLQYVCRSGDYWQVQTVGNSFAPVECYG